ncbi:phage tail protein [Providencia manganoxydans]|uniref:phage tail protein n=1 Tax=Providencia manganoxydans TaxID=2923283 RepID=UPI0034E46D7B
MTPFYTILTNYGKTVLAEALAAQQPLEIPHMAVGDGGGAYYDPVEEQTNLRNELWRGDLNDLRTDANVQGQVIAEAIIPMGIDGDWTVREIGLFDAKGGLIAVGKYPETYIPSALSGAKSQVHISIIINVDNVAAVQLIVDHGQVLASKLYVSDQVHKFQEKIQEDNGENVFVSLSTTKYLRVGNFKRGAVLTNENDCLKYGNFYYAYRDSEALPLTVNPNSSPDNHWICVGDANMHHDSHTLFNFGGKDDSGKTDNRQAIQLAIEYMEFSGSKLLTNSSRDDKRFAILSKHPNAELNTCIHISKPRQVDIFGGRNRNTSIVYMGEDRVQSVFRVKAGYSDWGMKIESLGVHGGFKADHILLGDDYWYAQNIFTGGCYEGSLISGIRLSTWMCTLNRVYCTHTGDYGYEFIAPTSSPDQAATSINLTNCFARNVRLYGYSVKCTLWYSKWTNNGCDGVDVFPEYAYYFAKQADGVSIENCGSENVKRYLYMSQPRSVKISGIRCAAMHPDANSALITFNTAYDVKLENLGPYDNDKFVNEIEILAASGNEHITVDQTFTESKLKVTKVASYYTYPNIFFYENNATKSTRGLTKLNNIIYAGTQEVGLNGNYESVIEKTYILRKSEADVTKSIFQFYDTYNVDVFFTAHYSGGANTSYTTSTEVFGYTLQEGITYWHNADNKIIKMTNVGTELFASIKPKWSTVLLTCKIMFRYDPKATVVLRAS